RHGPMVLRVCSGVLRDPTDVEDAFQATFLVLARKVGSIREPEAIASWLYGVALRIAANKRAAAIRRRGPARRFAAVASGAGDRGGSTRPRTRPPGGGGSAAGEVSSTDRALLPRRPHP